MATEGSHFNTRMSAEAQNSVKNNAAMLFKKYKVEISNAIKTSFPFLEILHDRGYITSEKYKEYRENFEKEISIQEVIYNILSDLEKIFDLPLLDTLFSKFIVKKYPGLNYIYKIFQKEIPNIKNFLESDVEENEGRSDIQLSLGQGPGENSYLSLPWNHNESMNFKKPPTSGNIHCKRGSKKHQEEYVDFHSEILPMTCGEMKGMLYKNKLEEGSTVKCIKTEDGRWFTLQEFEAAGGYKSSSNWKNTVRCGGKTLKRLMEEEKLPIPPRKYGRKKKLEKPGVCVICRDGENLLRCDTCSRSFHGDCHLPPVQTERPLRRPWSCTFCRIKESSGNLQCHKESEVLARQMGPEEQLKCEFLLLEIYCHSDNDCSEKMPQDNYTPEIFECMKNLQMLKEIGRKLREQCYPKVESFMKDMRLIFQNHKAFNKCKDLFLLGITLEKKFEKNFTEVFAIQEVKQEHTDNKIKKEKSTYAKLGVRQQKENHSKDKQTS
ncbi:nuclear body protein SP140-like protein isoform X2 [Artibeus jamaicensis]|uniref:nuclear body protein SP140-like protein isoform X2 n=1 Tax=Artibeus jamaicensis TaxID=9417 RepID=UPI00235B1086|nr:nuclear body protein SP140-like protein isoform X2 [Artibeus jamaicensis]